MGGICDLITSGAPPLHCAAPDFADVPVAPTNKDSCGYVAANFPEPVGRATVREEIRVPPVTPKAPPPILGFRGDENGPTADVPSDYQSDEYEDWYSSRCVRNRNRDCSK